MALDTQKRSEAIQTAQGSADLRDHVERSETSGGVALISDEFCAYSAGVEALAVPDLTGEEHQVARGLAMARNCRPASVGQAV